MRCSISRWSGKRRCASLQRASASSQRFCRAASWAYSLNITGLCKRVGLVETAPLTQIAQRLNMALLEFGERLAQQTQTAQRLVRIALAPQRVKHRQLRVLEEDPRLLRETLLRLFQQQLGVAQ